MNGLTCRCYVINSCPKRKKKEATAGWETQLSNRRLLPDFQFKRKIQLGPVPELIRIQLMLSSCVCGGFFLVIFVIFACVCVSRHLVDRSLCVCVCVCAPRRCSSACRGFQVSELPREHTCPNPLPFRFTPLRGRHADRRQLCQRAIRLHAPRPICLFIYALFT